MKVSLVTLHRVYNYGSILQTYATQLIFEKMGHEIEIIDYIPYQHTKKGLLFGSKAAGMNKGLPGFVYKVLKFFSIALKELTIGSFLRKNLNLTSKFYSFEEIERNPPKADCYITGSDQTWNSYYNGGIDRTYFLDFIDCSNKISFVASFGKTELEENERVETKRLLDNYRAISIREKSGLNILYDMGFNNAVQLIDPTLQISRQDWLNVASRRLVKEPYVILMLLYNEDNHATEYARYIADKLGFKLVKLSWELRKPEKIDKLFTHRSPQDFLSLFAHAEYVVTNSFHGLAFSLIFNRQFSIVPRNEFNSRIESLLDLVDLKNRMVSSGIDVDRNINDKILFDKVNQILLREQILAESFIREQL